MQESRRAQHVAACVEGDADACGEAGADYNSPLAQYYDQAKARDYFTLSCAMKPSKWCNEAGKLAAPGKGGAVDADYALAAFRLACLSGDKRGCSNVTLMKYHGSGVPQDQAAARAEWTALCEEDGLDASCHNLAGMWAKGEGGEPMPEAAAAMYEKLCQEGYKASCNMREDNAAQ